MIQWDFPVDEPAPALASRRRHLNESLEVLAEQIRSGMSIRALASAYGVSRGTIRCALARTDLTYTEAQEPQPSVPLRRMRAYHLPGRGRSRTFTPAEAAVLLARRDCGESFRSLARATGVSHETMRRTLAQVAPATKNQTAS